ncbi:unnamed protein product, partial [Coregonus sp. 'balchen']
HQLIVLLQFPPSPHSHFSRSSLPLSLDKPFIRREQPEESEPCTSTDDDSSLAGQEQVVAPGLATPSKQCRRRPYYLDSSLPVPDDSGGAAVKSNSQTKNIKD